MAQYQKLVYFKNSSLYLPVSNVSGLVNLELLDNFVSGNNLSEIESTSYSSLNEHCSELSDFNGLVGVECVKFNKRELIKENRRRWLEIKQQYLNRVVKYTNENVMNALDSCYMVDCDSVVATLYGNKGVGKLTSILDYAYSRGYEPYYIDGTVIGMESYFAFDEIHSWTAPNILLNHYVANLFKQDSLGKRCLVIVDNSELLPNLKYLLTNKPDNRLLICLLSDNQGVLHERLAVSTHFGRFVNMTTPTYRQFYDQVKLLTGKTDREIFELHNQIGELPEVLSVYLQTGSIQEAKELSNKLVGGMLLDSFLLGGVSYTQYTQDRVVEALDKLLNGIQQKSTRSSA